MERMPSSVGLPRREVEQPVKPKRREKTLLERVAKGPAGRWVIAAMLALSSQGCASFRVGAGPSFGGGGGDDARRMEEPPSAQEAAETPGITGGDVLRTVAAVVTGEGKADSGVNIRGGYQQYGEGEGFTSVKLEPTAELPGMRQWWSKPEGAYDPEEAAYHKEYKAEEENVGKAVFEKTPERARLFKHSPATASDHRYTMGTDRADRMNRVGYGPIPENVKRITFEKGEKKPDAVTAVVHERPGDTPASMMERGIAMVLPTLTPNQGVRIEWHGGRQWAAPKTMFAFERVQEQTRPIETAEVQVNTMSGAVRVKKGFVPSVILESTPTQSPTTNPLVQMEVDRMNQYLSSGGEFEQYIKKAFTPPTYKERVKKMAEDESTLTKGPVPNLSLMVTAIETPDISLDIKAKDFETEVLQVGANPNHPEYRVSKGKKGEIAKVAIVKHVSWSAADATDTTFVDARKAAFADALSTAVGAFSHFKDARLYGLQKSYLSNRFTAVLIVDSPTTYTAPSEKPQTTRAVRPPPPPPEPRVRATAQAQPDPGTEQAFKDLAKDAASGGDFHWSVVEAKCSYENPNSTQAQEACVKKARGEKKSEE